MSPPSTEKSDPHRTPFSDRANSSLTGDTTGFTFANQAGPIASTMGTMGNHESTDEKGNPLLTFASPDSSATARGTGGAIYGRGRKRLRQFPELKATSHITTLRNVNSSPAPAAPPKSTGSEAAPRPVRPPAIQGIESGCSNTPGYNDVPPYILMKTEGATLANRHHGGELPRPSPTPLDYASADQSTPCAGATMIRRGSRSPTDEDQSCVGDETMHCMHRLPTFIRRRIDPQKREKNAAKGKATTRFLASSLARWGTTWVTPGTEKDGEERRWTWEMSMKKRDFAS